LIVLHFNLLSRSKSDSDVSRRNDTLGPRERGKIAVIEEAVWCEE